MQAWKINCKWNRKEVPIFKQWGTKQIASTMKSTMIRWVAGCEVLYSSGPYIESSDFATAPRKCHSQLRRPPNFSRCAVLSTGGLVGSEMLNSAQTIFWAQTSFSEANKPTATPLGTQGLISDSPPSVCCYTFPCSVESAYWLLNFDCYYDHITLRQRTVGIRNPPI